MPDTAMILAAGLGTRMRSHRSDIPKPLVPVAGTPLIDHARRLVTNAGVARLVVNLHHQADALQTHLSEWRDRAPIYSLEPHLLETGGGVAKALPLIARDRFFVLNSDVLCIDGATPALRRLTERWDDVRMDALLLVVPLAQATGYIGDGDFNLAADGALQPRMAGEPAVVFTGVQLLHRRLFDNRPTGPFKLGMLYRQAQAAGRLFGLAHDGDWLHVGDADGVAAAERYLAGQ